MKLSCSTDFKVHRFFVQLYGQKSIFKSAMAKTDIVGNYIFAHPLLYKHTNTHISMTTAKKLYGQRAIECGIYG